MSLALLAVSHGAVRGAVTDMILPSVLGTHDHIHIRDRAQVSPSIA